MKKQIIAAIAASVLFFASFALATGTDAKPVQAIPACILMATSAALFRYAERHGSASEELRVKSGKSVRKPKVA